MSYVFEGRIEGNPAVVNGLFLRAATLGHVGAQTSLGYFLIKGEAGSSDLIEGYKWTWLAEAQ